MTITCIRPGTDEFRARRARLGFDVQTVRTFIPPTERPQIIPAAGRAKLPAELCGSNKRTIRAIISAVSRHYGIRRGVLLSGAITPTVRWPRALCFYLAKSQTGLSFTEIAQNFKVNYGTVSKAHAQIGAILRDNPEFASEVGVICSLITKEAENGKGEERRCERDREKIGRAGDRTQL